MNLFSENKDFYPTTPSLALQMWHKIPREDRGEATYILDPSAGHGAIIETLKETIKRRTVYHAIENDPNLAAILRSKDITVIDSDFLSYSGPDKYDVIIMNPPFSVGDQHLLKAIDVMYSGHIVCLLNADTIRNPYTNIRKALVRKLEELAAEIEYRENAFSGAARQTDVDIAIVHIHIKRNVETDLFDGVSNTSDVDTGHVDDTGKELTQNSIRDIVADYNRRVEIGTQTLINYYENFRHIGGYIHIKTGDNDGNHFKDSLTDRLKKDLNGFLVDIRKTYWRKVLLLDKVREKMTASKRKEFEKGLQDNSFMDFTETNIRQFILNLINSYEDILTEATVELFDRMTRKHAWDEDLHNKNVHYFDGWKTNNAFMANKKVIVPFFYQEAFWDPMFSRWSLGWRVHEELDDIDKVMNYFDGRSEYTKISTAINDALTSEDNFHTSKIKSTYFIITVYKKGTCHLTFRDENIRRRFNVTACKGKSWLPHDYGTKKYSDMTAAEKTVVDSFEGERKYSKNLIDGGKSLFANQAMMQLPMVA